jgi:hypothetical protein
MPTPPVGDARSAVGGSEPAIPDQRTAARFAEATRYVEQINRSRIPPGSSRSDSMRWTLVVQIIATIASASSTATPRFGTAYRCDFNGTTWVPSSDVVDVGHRSPTGTALVNSIISCIWVGYWELNWDPC